MRDFFKVSQKVSAVPEEGESETLIRKKDLCPETMNKP